MAIEFNAADPEEVKRAESYWKNRISEREEILRNANFLIFTMFKRLEQRIELLERPWYKRIFK